MKEEYIIAHADKLVLKIKGLEIKGLNTVDVESILSKKLQSFVRVIGVTGENIEMDVYGVEPTDILKNESGIIESIALAEGITLTDLTKMSCSEKIVPVDFEEIPDTPISACKMERWISKKQ